MFNAAKQLNNGDKEEEVCWQANITLIARFMGPTWGPSGADKTQVVPMLAP